VARVGGVPVYASAIHEHARATSSDRRRALDDLIAQELLAQEARRRGFAEAPEVLAKRKQALVRRFISQEFERKTAAPEAVPEHDARLTYQQMYEYFHHQRMLRVLNVCTDETSARALWSDLHARPPHLPDEFRALAARHGAAASELLTEETSRGYHPAWRQAVFAALHKSGDVMPPIRLDGVTPQCSWFVAFCEEYFPARDDSFAQALPEIRRRTFEDWRRHAFQSWSASLVREDAVAVNPEAIPE